MLRDSLLKRTFSGSSRYKYTEFKKLSLRRDFLSKKYYFYHRFVTNEASLELPKKYLYFPAFFL